MSKSLTPLTVLTAFSGEGRRNEILGGKRVRVPILDVHSWKLRQIDLKQQSTSGVYFAQAEQGAVKIGISVDVQKRLELLQTSNYEELRPRLVCEMTGMGSNKESLESFLHSFFAEDRIRGEWFHPTPCLREFMKNPLESPLLANYEGVSSRSSERLFPHLNALLKACEFWGFSIIGNGQGFKVLPENNLSSVLETGIYEHRLGIGERFGWLSTHGEEL